MVKLLTDESLNGRIVNGLVEKHPDVSVSRVQDTEVFMASDPDVLEYAARQGLIVVTHDIRTMREFAYQRVRTGLPMPGVIEVGQHCPIGLAIEELHLIAAIGRADDLMNLVYFIPM